MSLYFSETYLRTLGLSAGASDSHIKQAYRRKAKELHPDRNLSPNAHQEFIQLTEAYEYLINHRNSDIGQQYTQYNYQPTYQTPDNSSQWQNEARDEARRRAAEHANMRYDDFVDTDYYKSLRSVETVFRYLLILMLILLVVGVCTFLVASSGAMGVFFSALFLVLPVSLLYAKLRDEQLDLTDLHESGVFLIQQKWFLGFIFTIFNFYAIIRYGFQTLIGIWWLPAVYLVVILCCMVSIVKFMPTMSVFHKCFYALCLAPLIMSILFFINFTFAHDPMQEIYPYTYGTANEIILSGDKYNEYPYIRMFADDEQMKGNNTITYTFADGLLGMRVVKGYKLDVEN